MAALLAAIPVVGMIRADMWERPMRMDNRLYFYIAERAASGVPPHVSAPEVKSQLATLTDAFSISVGRLAGLGDVHAGRIGALLILIWGIWGVGASVFALGATPAAAMLAAISVMAFSGLVNHCMYGFNPKILMFTLLAWGPFLVAKGSFAAAGAVATAAMLCWQPAAIACMATAAAALGTSDRVRSLVRCIAGGAVVFVLYEAWFAWHGALAPQLFQTFVLPLGSVHDPVDWPGGARFVAFGGNLGLDRFALPAASFALVLAGSIARRLGLDIPGPGRSAAPAPAVLALLIVGVFVTLFTVYEHHGEPDRFLLCATFATSLGVVIDRVLHWVRRRALPPNAFRLEGALALMLLLVADRGEGDRWRNNGTLEEQLEVGRMVAMVGEAYGSVWAYGCNHLLAIAHRTNHHPLDHMWDDLRRYVDEKTFDPRVHGEMPDVIVRCLPLPGAKNLLSGYVQLRAPGLLAEKARIYVRRELVEERADL